jgi:hypothetical protein
LTVGPPLSETFSRPARRHFGSGLYAVHPSDLSFVIELDIAFPALLDAAKGGSLASWDRPLARAILDISTEKPTHRGRRTKPLLRALSRRET